MNRIDELALKNTDIVGNYSYCEHVLNYKKYAKAIINECIDLIECRYCVSDIKQHFGIEE